MCNSCINTLDRIQTAPSKNRNFVSHKYMDYWINKSRDRPKLNKSLECARNKAQIGTFVAQKRKLVVCTWRLEGLVDVEHAFLLTMRRQLHKNKFFCVNYTLK